MPQASHARRNTAVRARARRVVSARVPTTQHTHFVVDLLLELLRVLRHVRQLLARLGDHDNVLCHVVLDSAHKRVDCVGGGGAES